MLSNKTAPSLLFMLQSMRKKYMAFPEVEKIEMELVDHLTHWFIFVGWHERPIFQYSLPVCFLSFTLTELPPPSCPDASAGLVCMSAKEKLREKLFFAQQLNK